MNFHILTLFPEMVMGGLSTSITGRAMEQKKINIEAVNIRDYTQDKHRKVDDYPYGGGAGMLMQAQPVYDAWEDTCRRIGQTGQPKTVPTGGYHTEKEYTKLPVQKSGDEISEGKEVTKGRIRTVYVTPQGHTFTQQMAEDFAKEEDLIILCGHYEGIDERVLEEVVTDYVSIGDYVLTGGELAAMVMADAISRLVPGVLNNEVSAETESFHGSLLEYPQYSRPESWHDKKVPEVLLSGNQKKIDAWRLEEAKQRTRERRPDLYQEYMKLQACRELLLSQKLLHMDMIQLIDRGRAELLYHEDTEILLRDKITGLCFHTHMKEHTQKQSGKVEKQMSHIQECRGGSSYISGIDFEKHIPAKIYKELHSFVFHQKGAADEICKRLHMHITCACNQAVLTRREKLSVSGLYRPDGKPMDRGKNIGLVIRPLDVTYAKEAAEHYHLLDDPEYIRQRLEKGQMFGAFLPVEKPAGDKGQDDNVRWNYSAQETSKNLEIIENGSTRLVGYIGFHEEGSIGMLEVFPEYQRRGIGMALETYIMNLTLERGWIPYGQIIVGNDNSMLLQKKMGLCVSKEQLFWAAPDFLE